MMKRTDFKRDKVLSQHGNTPFFKKFLVYFCVQTLKMFLSYEVKKFKVRPGFADKYTLGARNHAVGIVDEIKPNGGCGKVSMITDRPSVRNDTLSDRVTHGRSAWPHGSLTFNLTLLKK